MDGLKEKHRVILLPTQKAENALVKYNGALPAGFIWQFYPGRYFTQEYIKSTYSHSYHLYICSEGEIKEGDWFINLTLQFSKECYMAYRAENDADLQHLNSDKKVWVKIEASTDRSLGLPEPSKEFIDAFIKEYNRGNLITEVMVEMEYGCKNGHTMHYKAVCRYPFCDEQTHLVPYVKSDNTITITKVVEDWNDLHNAYTTFLGENNLTEHMVSFFAWVEPRYLPPVKIK